MAKHKQRTVRVRPETHGRPTALPAPTPHRRARLTPAVLWGAAAVTAIALGVGLLLAVGTAGFTGHSRWGFIACLFFLGVTTLICGAKSTEAFLNWKEPGWQPPPRKDD